MTKVFFAGLNTAPIAAALEGRNVLMSFADFFNGHGGVLTREVIPRLRAGKYADAILDSGAFSVISAGIEISCEEYGAWALDHKDLFSQVINLDDIAGDVAVSWRNQEYLEGLGLNVIPVFHQDESLEVLEHYVSKYERIGVGFARKAGGRLKYGIKKNRKFLEAVFAKVDGRAKMHGFAMTHWALQRGFPFDTTDSTSWISEFRGLCKVGVETHSVRGFAARVAAKLGRDGRYKLALDSYGADAGGELAANPDLRFLARSKGQARTVFKRFDVAELGGWLSAEGVAA